MNLVDSSGWLEYFADASNAGFFAPAIEEISKLLVPTICLLEVFKRILQQRGEDSALQAAAMMMQGKMVDLIPHLALSAAKISFDHKLPMADSVILATARQHHATLWTQDADFKGLEGVKFKAKQS